MSIEELIEKGSIHPFEATRGEIERAIGIARRDLTLAEKLLEENFDWCFSIATMLCCKLAGPICSIWDIGLPALKHTRLPLSSCRPLWKSHLRNPSPILTERG